jgi:hypothetical protein
MGELEALIRYVHALKGQASMDVLEVVRGNIVGWLVENRDLGETRHPWGWRWLTAEEQTKALELAERLAGPQHDMGGRT